MTAPDATAGDGLREVESIAEWLGYSFRSSDARHAAEMLRLALPALRDVLAAAARDAEELDAAQATLDALRELHHPEPAPYGQVCASCLGSDEELLAWPCPSGALL